MNEDAKTVFLGFKISRRVAMLLQAYVKEKDTTSSEVIRTLLESLLLTPDERLEGARAAQAEFERGIEELQRRRDAKIENARMSIGQGTWPKPQTSSGRSEADLGSTPRLPK